MTALVSARCVMRVTVFHLWCTVTLYLHQNKNIKTQKQGIHRHQTPPRYRNAASGGRLKVQPSTVPRIAIRPTTAKRDVIHKTRST